MAQQPARRVPAVCLRARHAGAHFRVDGDRAYGLGIADDKHGIAVNLRALTIGREGAALPQAYQPWCVTVMPWLERAEGLVVATLSPVIG